MLAAWHMGYLWRALLQPEVVGANLWIWKGTLSSI
jgi:hypothetical protein